MLVDVWPVTRVLGAAEVHPSVVEAVSWAGAIGKENEARITGSGWLTRRQVDEWVVVSS